METRVTTLLPLGTHLCREKEIQGKREETKDKRKYTELQKEDRIREEDNGRRKKRMKRVNMEKLLKELEI